GRKRDQVGTGECQPTRELREIEVVADRQSDPAERRFHNRRRLGARREPELLPVPEMCLAIDGEQSVGTHHGCRVVERAVVTQLREASDDHHAEVSSAHYPCRNGWPVRRLAAGARFVEGLEDIAGGSELREENNLRLHRPPRPDGVLHEFEIRPEVAHTKGKLRTRDSDVRHRPRFTATPSPRQDPAPWSSPSFPPTSPS